MLPITRSRHDHPSLSGHPLAVIRPTEPACVALPVLGVLPRRHKGVEGERCGTHYQHPPSRLGRLLALLRAIPVLKPCPYRWLLCRKYCQSCERTS